jgi:hypothetical protein
MNRNEALAFLNPSQGNQLGTPAQPESMSPDEIGPQLVPQSRATGMSQEDALAFLGINQQQKAPISDSAYLNAPVPEPDLPPSDPNNLTSNYTQSVPQATPQNANQKPQGMSKEDALAFLSATPSATPEQTGKVINLPATPSKEQNVFDKALEQYPVLKNANAVGLMSTNAPDGANMLESWQPNEQGTPDRPRPKELPSDKLGVQIYSDKTTPNDVAADIVSHSLVKTDPNLKATYDQFASSITPDQKDFLMGDYEQEVKQATLSGGEKPPAFDQWMQQVGIPSAFRGYAFGQYDQKAQQQFGYTDQQKQLLGGVKPYLEGGQQSQQHPYDWKGAAIAAGSTAVEQGTGLIPGMMAQKAISTAVPIPIIGPALGIAGMLAVQQATEYGIKKLEDAFNVRQQIEEAQQAHPTVSTVTGYATMAPFAINSLKNIGIGFAKTLSTDGAIAAAKNVAQKIIGGSIGGTALGPIRYGLEYFEYKTGIRKEKPTPITSSEELENGIIGAILVGHEEAKKADAAVGGPAPSVAPSANPVVNEREAKINAMANEQAPIPEAPKPVETIPVAPEKPETPADVKLTELLTEQIFHEEGSPEHTAIQQQIDQLKAGEAPTPVEVTIEEQPAKAPAEAQPTTENAVQEPSAREVGVRNAPAVGEGVGAENKPEIPAEEGKVTKEEVKPQEVQLTDEQQAEKVLLDKIDAEAGKPKPPTPYTGVASQPSGETISIRSDDQKDQIKRGILTSVVPAGEGTSRSEILEQGNTNLKNGANPFDALEKAKKGDFDALTTAKAYSQALAKKVSDALKKFGPNSPEYKELAKQYQDYYEGIREAGTVASDILRTFQGQTDLSDAADIARQYTQITGDEPSLSKHEQIRKVADEVKTSIEQSDKAIEDHKSSMDEGLSNVEVKTPESVEEGRQQIADLSDASGKKNKAEIDRLNAELEQTKKTLEEVKQARETGQDAEALKAYYEAKIKDLEAQKSPKFGKEVLEQAQKLVDKWRADRLEAEKLLTKQLAQMGSFPDVSIVSTLARIMRGHISEFGLDFAKSSKLILDKFGPKVEKYLKEAWDKAHSLIKGEDGGEKAVKSVRKVKAKPESKMSPEEKKLGNLQKRIDQYQKKIDEINSGKVSTPKEVENVTNEEIRGLEADLAKKKQELSDARLKAKQADLFEKGKLGEKLNPEQVKTLWESAKRFYLDKGESDYDKMINDLANDFGITTKQVREAFSSPKGAKKTSDQLYLKQRNRQLALNKANRWLENQKANFIGKVFGVAAERTFKLAIFGHGTAFIGTHAPTTIYTHPKAAFRAWLKGLSYTFRGKDGRIKNAIDNKDLIYRPNWVTAKRAGLENDPFQNEHEGPSKATSDSILGRSLDALTGGRGFDALYHLRQDMFDQAWDKLSITQKTPEMAKIIADSINNATGFTKGGKNTAGILQSPITKVLFFAPKLIASRFNWLIGDPARMIGTFANMANPFAKVTSEERMSAFSEAKNKLAFLGTLAGTLLANQALLSVTGSNQSINFTDPKKNDWLAYKGFGYNFATVGAMTRIARLLSQEYKAVFGDLTRIQKARGGREAAMKDALYTYFRSGFSPIVRDIVVAATGKDYIGNVVPWSSEQPDRGRRRLTWGEIVQEQLAPIPISEAATQKEIGPAIAKAGTAAFLGARLETPADIEEYQKSLQSKPRGSSNGSFGSKKLFH